MITHTDSFKDQLAAISNLLLIEGQQPRTTYITRRLSDYKISRQGLDEWYTANFKSFPLYTSNRNDEVTIHSSFRHYFLQYHNSEDFKDATGEHIKEVGDFERDCLLLDLEEYIREWIENMFYDFAEIMNLLKAGPVFACITDNMIIIKNLLKFYKGVRKSEEIQLHFFHNISIPKTIADLMTDVLIQLLSDKLNMISSDPPIEQAFSSIIANNYSFKINWLASQQEFAELVHELSQKGYLSLPDMSMAAQARQLANIFDFSASQRKTSANIVNNLLAVLKPIQNKELKTTTYSYLKPGYERKFACIPQRKLKAKKQTA